MFHKNLLRTEHVIIGACPVCVNSVYYGVGVLLCCVSVVLALRTLRFEPLDDGKDGVANYTYSNHPKPEG